MVEVVPFVDGKLSFALQHWGLSIALQHEEFFPVRCIELTLIIRTKTRERTRSHQKLRLMTCGLSITMTRRTHVLVAGARIETHVLDRLSCMKTSLQHCGEVGIEEESGQERPRS